MARMSDEQMAEIVEQEMPGYRMADRSTTGGELDARQDRAAPEASTPELETLRSKYFSDSSSGDDDVLDHEFAGDEGGGEAGGELAYNAHDDEDADDEDADDDEIVHVVPEDSSDPWDRAHRPKSIVFSHKKKRVVGWQG